MKHTQQNVMPEDEEKLYLINEEQGKSVIFPSI